MFCNSWLNSAAIILFNIEDKVFIPVQFTYHWINNGKCIIRFIILLTPKFGSLLFQEKSLDSEIECYSWVKRYGLFNFEDQLQNGCQIYTF